MLQFSWGCTPVQKVSYSSKLPMQPQQISHRSNHVHLSKHRQVVASQFGGVLSEGMRKSIDEMVEKNKILCFIKGSKMFPQCGFSNTVVQIFNSLDVPYETVDVLEQEQLRAAMKQYSMWPTFPQVYIGGEFYGGCDILIKAYQTGELQEHLTVQLNS